MTPMLHYMVYKQCNINEWCWRKVNHHNKWNWTYNTNVERTYKFITTNKLTTYIKSIVHASKCHYQIKLQHENKNNAEYDKWECVSMLDLKLKEAIPEIRLNLLWVKFEVLYTLSKMLSILCIYDIKLLVKIRCK